MEHQDQQDPIGILEGHSPAESYFPEEDERELSARLNDRFTEAESARSSWESDAAFFLLYQQGDQLLVRSRTTNEILRLNVSSDNPRVLHSIDNLLRPAARALQGKLSRIIPTMTVLPRTEDSDELRAASVADSLLDYVFRHNDLREKYVNANGQLPWAGTAIFQLEWNRLAGGKVGWCGQCSYVSDEESIGQPCPQCELEAQSFPGAGGQPTSANPTSPPPAPPLKEARQGDIEVSLLDPREFYPEPGTTSIKDMRWCCVRRVVPVSRLREMFPEHAEHIRYEDGIYSDKVLGFFGTGTVSKSSLEPLKDHAYLYQFYEVPTAKFPQGRMIYKVRDIILRQQPCPYSKLGRLPFYVFRWELNEGEFWGEPPISQAWSIQRERNKLLQQLRTHRDLTVHPRVLDPITSRISVDEWDDKPNRVIKYNPMGGKPAYMEIPSFAQYVYSELDRMRLAVLEKYGVTDQEMGRAGGDTSGRFAAILEAQASESIAPVVVRNNKEWLELHRGILILAQAFYTPDRKWTITGRERVQTFSFDQMNLREGWDITLSEEDSLSKNPALRLEQAKGLLAVGALNDERTGMPDMRMFRRIAGLKLPGVGPDLIGAEHAYAAKIPEMVQAGQPFQPRPWDDVRVIAEELLGWLRGPGRNAAEPLVQQVGQIWMAYAQQIMMAPVPSDAQLMPNQLGGMPQQQAAQQSRVGSEATAPPGGGPKNPQAEAGGIVREADETSENQANPGKHEG